MGVEMSVYKEHFFYLLYKVFSGIIKKNKKGVLNEQ